MAPTKIQYYISKLLCLLFLVGPFSFLRSQTKISVASGQWGNANTWSPSGVPTTTDNVLISNGHQVDIRSNIACNSLTVGAGSASTLQFRGNTARILSVTGNIVVNTNASFQVRTTSNKTHTLVASGNITNNGKIEFAPTNNSLVDVIFNKNGNQTISGSGTTNHYDKLILNMGTSSANILDITSTTFAANTDFLTLLNGTFRLSTINPVSVVPFTGAASLPSTSGLWVNSANAVVNTSASVTYSGNVTVSNGVLYIGDGNNEDLLSNGGTLAISGGTLNVSGKYNTGGSASTFSIGGGVMLVPYKASTNTTNAPFQITTAGSVFHMTGGSIIIPSEGGNGAQDLGFINTGSTSGAVTGGTLFIGNASSPINQTMRINTTYSVANLQINSANVTATLNTNSLNVTNHVIVSTGTLSPGNLNITLGGNWTNTSSFVAGTGIVTFNSNSAQSILKAGGETFNHLAFSGSGVKTFSSAVTTSGNFTINAGATVDVSASNFQLTVKGNYLNNGTLNTQSGLVFFNGSAAQTIGGSSVTNFYDVALTNAAGATLTNPENLIGTLTLNSGTFASAGFLTMVSTGTATARIASIPAGADISGNVIVQRFAPGGTTGWALFGTPISSALTLNDWDDDIYISCSTCPDGSAGGFLSIYTYDETKPGLYDDVLSYIPLGTINDPIVAGQGYWVYLGDGQFTTNNITIDVTGTVRKFNYTIPLKYTNNGSAADDGWNLITNPYPSPISWAALKGATSNIDNAIYVYNADLNGGAGGQASYVNGVSSPAVGSGGIGDVIPMSQGFQVHSTGATALNATEAIKVAGNPTYLKSSAASSNALLRLNLKNASGYNDETVLYFQNGATNGFDVQYDAYKMRGQDPYAPSVALEKGDVFQINGIPPVVGSFSMNVKTLTGYSGNYTLTASNFASFPSGACISLFDRFTSSTTNLKTSDYVFNLSDTTTVSRFIINITIDPLTVNGNAIQPVCQNVNGGAIIASGANGGPWNYYWKNSNGSVIKTTLNRSFADTLNNLSGGNFNLEMNTVGLCDNSNTTYNINPIAVPIAKFLAPDTTDINTNPSVVFNNISINAISYSWDFGDNSSPSALSSPIHLYTSTGIYTVSLTATSMDGCVHTSSRVIVVTDAFTGIKNAITLKDGLLIKTLDKNEYLLSLKLNDPTAVSFKLHDIYGKLVVDYGTIEDSSIDLPLHFKDLSSGVYFLSVMTPTEKVVIKLLAR